MQLIQIGDYYLKPLTYGRLKSYLRHVEEEKDAKARSLSQKSNGEFDLDQYAKILNRLDAPKKDDELTLQKEDDQLTLQVNEDLFLLATLCNKEGVYLFNFSQLDDFYAYLDNIDSKTGIKLLREASKLIIAAVEEISPKKKK